DFPSFLFSIRRKSYPSHVAFLVSQQSCAGATGPRRPGVSAMVCSGSWLRVSPRQEEGERISMGTRILIVEDDGEVVKVVSASLRVVGDEVKAVSDGSLGMAEIDAFKPAVVITDLMMPGLPGAVLIAQIRSVKELDDVKIIVYSAKNFEYDY